MSSKCDCGIVPDNIWGRRDFLRIGSLGALGLNLRDLMAATNGASDERSVILVWLSGGPAQLDTFDLKPNAPAGIRGTFKPIPTNVPGMTICEHMPRTAKVSDKHVVIRSMTSPVSDHGPGQHYLLTGYRPLPSLEFPSMGAVVSNEKGPRNEMPPYVAVPDVGPFYGPGFLGGPYGPFLSGNPNETNYRVRDLTVRVDSDWNRLNSRKALLGKMDSQFRQIDGEAKFQTVDSFYEKAYTLMHNPKVEKAFAIHEEPEETRNLYGRTPIGQGCLLARRLVQSGVRFVTVSKAYMIWDSHVDNFNRLEKLLLPELDVAYSALLTDLDRTGLLKNTMVVMCGEFGRTPKINAVAGRDHWGAAYCATVAGAGIVGGKNLGSTDDTASSVKEDPTTIEDLVATIYDRLGVDINKEYQTPIGRPIKISNGGQPIKKLFV